MLKNKIDIVLKEKNNLENSFDKMKKDFENYKISSKGKSPISSCNKNEFIEIQKRVDVLDSTLKKCAFDLNKFASRFPKGITQGKHTHHQHARKHAHTQACIHVW